MKTYICSSELPNAHARPEGSYIYISNGSITFRLTSLYRHALEVVCVGDRNTVAYEKAMDILKSAMHILTSLAAECYGKGLEA